MKKLLVILIFFLFTANSQANISTVNNDFVKIQSLLEKIQTPPRDTIFNKCLQASQDAKYAERDEYWLMVIMTLFLGVVAIFYIYIYNPVPQYNKDLLIKYSDNPEILSDPLYIGCYRNATRKLLLKGFFFGLLLTLLFSVAFVVFFFSI